MWEAAQELLMICETAQACGHTPPLNQAIIFLRLQQLVEINGWVWCINAEGKWTDFFRYLCATFCMALCVSSQDAKYGHLMTIMNGCCFSQQNASNYICLGGGMSALCILPRKNSSLNVQHVLLRTMQGINISYLFQNTKSQVRMGQADHILPWVVPYAASLLFSAPEHLHITIEASSAALVKLQYFLFCLSIPSTTNCFLFNTQHTFRQEQRLFIAS